MQIVYDIIGSMIVGGMILMMVLGFNANLIEGAGLQTYRTMVQGHMTTLTNIIEYDFRKMGYGVPQPQESPITYADTLKITFQGDFDNNGSIDKLTYALDPVKPPGITNPRVRILYRTLNSQPTQSMNVGITKFKISYYDSAEVLFAGNVVASPSLIKSMKVQINIESKEPYDTTYTGVFWERLIKPKNIR